MKDLNKNNPFKIPEDYFEGFNDRLRDKLLEESKAIPEEEGFTIPEGYFESLPQQLLQKVEEPKVIQLNPYKKYYYSAAAVAAIVLVVFGLNFNRAPELTFEDLAGADIENYFEHNEFDLSAYELAEVIPVDELEINDIIENQFNEENVIEYLNENIDDYEELNIESYE